MRRYIRHNKRSEFEVFLREKKDSHHNDNRAAATKQGRTGSDPYTIKVSNTWASSARDFDAILHKAVVGRAASVQLPSRRDPSPVPLPTLPAFRALLLLSQLGGATDSTRSFGWWSDESRREAGWPPTATRRSRGRRRGSPPRPPGLEPTIWTTRSSCAASVCEFVADTASPFPSLIPTLSSGGCRSFCYYGRRL